MAMQRSAGLVSRMLRASTASRFAQARAFSSENKLKLTFATPYDVLADNEEVEWVSVPGAAGTFGVYPNHVPTIAQLQPGLVRVSKDGEVQNYFVSGGFAFVHQDSSCELSAGEAVPVDQIDADLARKALEDSQRELGSAQSDEAKARAEIGVEVATAMVGATQ